MKFQLLLVLSLAYASSAQQYNYYARPLSATGYGPTATPPPPPPPTTTESYKSYAAAPMMTSPERQLTREENPCSEEVLRATEIQAFKDPMDRRSYIVCTEIDVFVRMPCATGTFFDETIRHCVPDGWVPPICPVGLCKNSADCIIDELKNEYKCMCRVGYTGIFCETNIDECALEGNAYCSGIGGQCVDQLNAYYCDFGSKIGLTVDTAIEKPCTLLDLSLEKQFFKIESPMDNAYLQCLGENRWLVSKCAEMLFWNQELRTCSIEQPIKKTGVCKTYPCKNGGSCEDLGNFNFQCTCSSGYEGALCEQVIDFCLPMPCGTGRCVSHPGGHNCVCNGNIVDKSCDQMIQNPCTKPLDYFPHSLDFTKYISCGLTGLAFVKQCAPTTFWDNNLKTCNAEQKIILENKPKMSIFGPRSPGPSESYGSYTAPPTFTPPMTTPKYETKYETVTPRFTPPPVDTYGSYTAPPTFTPPMTTPKYQTPPTFVQPPPPMETYKAQYEVPRIVAPVKPAYGQQRPQINRPKMSVSGY